MRRKAEKGGKRRIKMGKRVEMGRKALKGKRDKKGVREKGRGSAQY
jgi:hypothetical protein